MADYLVDASLLGVAGGGDVGKGGIPTTYLAMGKLRTDNSLFFFVDEGGDLVYTGQGKCLFQRYFANFIYTERFVEDEAHLLVFVAHADVVFAHNKIGFTLRFAEIQ